MSRFNVLVATAAEDICDDVAVRARDIATESGEGLAAAHAALVALVKKSLHASRPDISDARAALWRVRIQLMPVTEHAAIEADTDPELTDLDAPGSLYIRGLPAVGEALREMAQQFHAGREIHGMTDETLRHSIKAFRPTLSRQDGRAVWRPKYSLLPVDGVAVVQPVAGSLKGLRGGSRSREFWAARVQVERCEESVS